MPVPHAVLPILACLTAGLALAGCRGPTRSVTIEVTIEGRAVPAAHVRAVALDASDVPLPVTTGTLSQAASALPASGITDEAGRVTIVLDRASPYFIEVAGVLGRSDWVAQGWVLERGADIMHRASPAGSAELRVVGPRAGVTRERRSR